MRGARLARLGSVVEGCRRWFSEPEPPLAAIEVRLRSLGVVRAVRERGRRRLEAAACLELPEGALSLSMSQPNLAQPEAFRAALRSLIEKAGLAGGGLVGLVLPDAVARVALLPAADVKARGRAEMEELLRFRLRKAVPFDTREAEVACLPPQAPGGMLLAAAVARPVLAGYEEACRELGCHPGVVELAGLSLLAAQAQAAGDRLLVNWDDGYVTLILTRDGWPLLVRTLPGDAASADDVSREVANTALYHRERLGGTGIESALVRSAALPLQEALAVVGGALGIEARPLEPPRGLAEEAGVPAHAVAGAAACVLGEAA